jgi:hypothetical protein
MIFQIGRTNLKSRRTIDWVIGNLHFELSVDYVPKFIINENCRLHNQLFIGNDFCGRELPQYIVTLPTGDKMRNTAPVVQTFYLED